MPHLELPSVSPRLDLQEMMRPVGSPGYAAPEVIALVPERYNEKAVFVRASNQRDRRRPGTDWDSAEHR